jgi:adenylate cyclase
MSQRRKKLLYYSVVLLVIGVCCTLIFTLFQPLTNVNLWLGDKLFVPEKPSSSIVIAGIDDKTLQSLGRLSDWPRELHARAVTNLAKDKARVIGFDVLFLDQSADDVSLAQAVKNAGNVVLPVIGLQPEGKAKGIYRYNQVVSPITVLKTDSKAVGHVNVLPDPDGVVRRLPLVISDASSQQHGALFLAVLSTLFDQPLPLTFTEKVNSLHIINRDIILGDNFEFRPNFVSDIKAFTYISYSDIIAGTYDPQQVRNKVVLIGSTSAGDSDTWDVPSSVEKIPGVIIHAIALDTILRDRYVTESPAWITLIVLLLLTVLTVLILPRLKPLFGAVFIAGTISVYLVAVSIAFEHGYILNILYPLLTLATLFIGGICCQIVFVQKERNYIKALFGRYVSPEVAREIITLADNDKLKLGGEQREVTVLFADIRNFTRLSEHLSPAVLVEILNTYFSMMIDILQANGGIVNKFAGDSIMAIWNAPQDQPGHAAMAVKSAWEIQKALGKYRLQNRLLNTIQFGIGINTGQALAGNIGSLKHTEYTVIGDAVNLAARICETTPGDEIHIGPLTFIQCKGNVKYTKLEPVELKGKSEKVILYHIIEYNSPELPDSD